MDVFTDRVFGGNPLAVILDASGLTTAQMQAIAREFNYSESTFILPPREQGHTAHVRIFTSRVEVPFAGHPNVGTAVALAHELNHRGRQYGDHFIFEELAGLVPIRLHREAGLVVGAEFTAPRQLTIGSVVSTKDAAECVSLDPSEIVTKSHPPRVVSVGLPFLAVELACRESLARAKPNLSAHERVLPPVGTDALFTYARGEHDGELHARMFSPLDATIEDPATGSAAAAAIAHLASLRPGQDEEVSWRIEQGVELGRPSIILGHTHKRGGVVTAVKVSGRAVPVMSGQLNLS